MAFPSRSKARSFAGSRGEFELARLSLGASRFLPRFLLGRVLVLLASVSDELSALLICEDLFVVRNALELEKLLSLLQQRKDRCGRLRLRRVGCGFVVLVARVVYSARLRSTSRSVSSCAS